MPRAGRTWCQNGGFEQLQDGKPLGWQSELGTDWTVDTTTRHGGQASARFQRAADGQTYWISQTVTLDQTRAVPLVMSGWSKADNVEGTRGGEYSRLGGPAVHGRHLAVGPEGALRAGHA